MRIFYSAEWRFRVARRMSLTICPGVGARLSDFAVADLRLCLIRASPRRSDEPELPPSSSHPICLKNPGAEQREHIKRAGIDKLTIKLSVTDAAFVGAVDCALIWREQAKACNIDINIVREPDDGYWTNICRKTPFAATCWFGRPTIDWMMATAFTSNAVWNDTSWSNT